MGADIQVPMNETEFNEIIRALDFRSDFFDRYRIARDEEEIERVDNIVEKLRIYRSMLR